MKLGENSTKVMLGAVALLLVLNLVGPTSAQNRQPPQGIPDSGAQMQAIIEELRDLNKKVDAMTKTLESGNVKVQVVEKKEK